jgi:hypothetical protein
MSAQQAPIWKAGVARTIITPPPGVELAGLGYYLNRTWDRVHDDLHASALVLSDERGESVALTALDVLYADRGTIEAIRARAAAETGLRPEAICVNCSHSHNAPTLAFFDGAGEVNAEYVEQTIAKAAQAIIEAWRAREPARLHVGAARLTGFSYNRTRDGGPVDEQLGALWATRADGRPLAIAINFHTHPTVFWQVEPRSVSRDWPGHVVDLMEETWPGVTALYLQGSCGDSQPKLEYWTPERYREAGTIVFEAARRAITSSREITTPGIAAVEREALLPVRRWTREEVLSMYEEGKHRLATGDTTNWVNGIASKVVCFPHRLPERYGGSVERAVEAVSRFAVRWGEHALPRLETQPETRRAHFQAMRIGDAWVVTNPAEFFSTLALAIRQGWPHEDLLILGYANGSVSYLPDAYEVDRTSYASLHVPKAIRELPFTRDAGAAAVAESLAALRSLSA